VSEQPSRVLFLCTHNSARSQMAEGLLRYLGGGQFDAFSAGTQATHVRPRAVQAMAELGVDISSQQSKTLDRYLAQSFDKVITVCDQANEACPVFFGAKQRLHWSLPDPSQAAGTEEEQLAVYRQVRDALRERIGATSLAYLSLDGLESATGPADGFCRACLTGDYPTEIPADMRLAKLRFEGPPVPVEIR